MTPTRASPRISATTIHVDELVDRAMRGRVRVPTFQRGLKWREREVQELFDSVDRGYPIGTLLMWQRPAEAGEVGFGPVSVNAPKAEDTWWVVDGQQRLTSFVAALRHPDSANPNDPYVVFCDLESPGAPTFFRPHRQRPATDRDLPLRVVLDPVQFQDWLLALVQQTNRRDLVSVASDVATRIRNYRVPIYIVETGDPEVARQIFLRTNSSGRRLEAHEVFAALAPAATARRSTPEGVAARLATTYGPVEPNLVVKVARSLVGDDVTRQEGSRAPRVDDPDRAEWMQRAEASLDSALRFVVEAGVPHTRLLPARLTPIVALARMFDRHPLPSDRDRRLLRRWLWRGMFHDAMPSDARTLRRAVVAVGDDASLSVQALLAMVPREPPKEWLPERFDARHGPVRLAMLLLAMLNPASVLDSESDSVFAWLQEHEARAFTVLPRGPNTPEARFFTPGATPRVLQSRLCAWAAEDPAHPSLRSHLVTPEAAHALLRDDTAEFHRLRRARLIEHARDVWSARAEPDQGDRPALGGSS